MQNTQQPISPGFADKQDDLSCQKRSSEISISLWNVGGLETNFSAFLLKIKTHKTHPINANFEIPVANPDVRANDLATFPKKIL